MHKSIWRRMIATSITISLALTLLGSIAPSNTSAWTYMSTPYIWSDKQISLCFDPSISYARRNVILGSATWWEAEANVSIYEDCGLFGSFWDVYVNKVDLIGALAEGGCDAVGAIDTTTYNGRTVKSCVRGHLYFDTTSIEAWNWSNSSASVQDCIMSAPAGVGMNCKRDAKTIAAHEIGHILGLGHVFGGSCTQGRWVGQYWLPWTGWDWNVACTKYARPMMRELLPGNDGDWMWGVKQGFRRWYLTDDDIAGARALYGPA